jgi:hypothetical protein
MTVLEIKQEQQRFEQQLHRSASLGHAFSDRTVAQVRNASERATRERYPRRTPATETRAPHTPSDQRRERVRRAAGHRTQRLDPFRERSRNDA